MKQWTNIPPWTSQVSVQNRIDALDCTAESSGNIIYMMTGFDSSPRFTAKMSGNTVNGNSFQNVIDSINRDGLVPYSLWETPQNFDWGSYYMDIPKEVKNQAMRVHVQTIPPNLNKSPLWTVLKFSSGMQHAVCQINEKEYFDSEWGDPIKLLTAGNPTIVSQVSLKVTLMINCSTVKFADGKTLGIMIETPNSVQIIKATGEEQWRSWHKPDSYGKPTVNPDGTTNWDVEKQLNF